MHLTIIAAIFAAIASIVFAMQNSAAVTIDFLLWRFDGSLAVVLLLAVAAGAIIVSLLTTPATLRRQWLLARQKRRIEALEKDVKQLQEYIAELEGRGVVPDREAVAPPPYVGLKQIIMSKGSEDES